jgi:hypothetical protein
MTTAFFIARALAINDYARYEVALLFLYSHLMKTPIDYAGVAFYKLNNARARLEILERLLRKRYENKHAKFWESLGGRFGRLDSDRNHVVHWVVVPTINLQRPSDGVVDIRLLPPNVMDFSPNDPNIPNFTTEKFKVFSNSCDSYITILNLFCKALKEPETHTALLDICQQPVPDPIPDAHPLSQNYKAPGTQPQPSQE